MLLTDQHTPSVSGWAAVMAPTIFAKLTPNDGPTKFAFHEVVSRLKNQSNGNVFLTRFADVDTDKVYDADAARAFDETDANDSDSMTEPDTDTEKGWKQNRRTWCGPFVFDVAHLTHHRVWTGGKGRRQWRDCPTTQDETAQLPEFLLACFEKDKYHIRGKHVRFQLDQNGYLRISKASNSARLFIAVDGKTMGLAPCSLNQVTTNVQLGRLSFRLEYTDYSRTLSFQEQRNKFVQHTHGTDPRALLLTPTPAAETKTIGKWTFAVPLGKGATGKVFSATDDDGNVAAIKVVEKNAGTRDQLHGQIRMLHKLTDEAKAVGDRHILLLEQVIPDLSSMRSISRPFEECYLVLIPAVPQTLDRVITGQSTHNLTIFHDALLALKFFHDRNLLHHDVKPPNIGVIGQEVIFLDAETAVELPDSGQVKCTPGHSGTVGYLSPERELEPYGKDVDVWGLGISIFELLFGYHPLRFQLNPWRSGRESLRPDFHRKEAAMCHKLREYEPDTAADLLLRMLSHSYSKCNASARVSINEALLHPVFETLSFAVKAGPPSSLGPHPETHLLMREHKRIRVR